MSEPIKPPEVVAHQPDFKEGAWQGYTLAELGNFVHLLAKRSQNRNNPEKRAKDLYDAQAYLNMMQSQLDALKEG